MLRRRLSQAARAGLRAAAAVPGIPAATGRARGAARPPLKLAEIAGKHGFAVERIEAFPLFQATAYCLSHVATGAQWVHVDCADTNNTFMVGFRTPPTDSTGVAHILEHTALCGSQLFPVRDPFFNMLKRSLNTFMNAMTYPDHTTYPFSTQNEQDLNNLMAVYLDATFFPNLRRLDFLQEGHRLSYNPESKELAFEGVVYNEMKGAMSDSASIFYQELQRRLFPTNTYHHNSGGDPADIPNLTYEQLCEFHAIHYHPSNAFIYSYGDLPPHLEYVNKAVLQHFKRLSPLEIPEVPNEVRLEKPAKFEGFFPANPLAADPTKQTTLGMAYLSKNLVENSEDTVGMLLLSKLLLETPSAPMYKSLLLPNYGSGYSPGTGFATYYKENVFSVGLQDIRDADCEKVAEIIQETLHETSEKGFDFNRIEAVVHQVELSTKSVKSTFGRSLGSAATAKWVYGCDPLRSLRTPEVVDSIYKKVKDGDPFFQRLIKEQLLNNPHVIRLEMRPDGDYVKKLEAKEVEKLETIKSKLNETDFDEIVKLNEELKIDQEKQTNAHVIDSKLPTLHVSDISKEVNADDFQFTIAEVKGREVQWNEHATNGIGYVRAALNLDRIAFSAEEKLVLPLYAAFVTELGAGNRDLKQLADEIDLKTGGISSSVFCTENHSDSKVATDIFSMSGSSLMKNTTSLFELLTDIFTKPRFDEHQQLKTLLLAQAASASEALSDSGHSYALSYAAAQTGNVASVRAESYSGLAFTKSLSVLASSEQLEKSIPWLISAFEGIATKLRDASFDRFSFNGDPDTISEIKSKLDSWPLIDSLRVPQSPFIKPTIDVSEHAPATSSNRFSYFSLPIQVHHIALCIPTVPYTHPDSAHLRLLATLMSSEFLHREIRERGGAYGSGARHGSSVFSFFSYRDPNRDKTIETFREAVLWASGKIDSPTSPLFTRKDLDQALLKLFSSLDSPISPGGRGSSYFFYRKDKVTVQQHRNILLNTQVDDLVRVANTYLLPAVEDLSNPQSKSYICVVGKDSSVPSSTTDKYPWITKTPKEVDSPIDLTL